MSRRGRAPVEAPGQDSFLDVVANLVGILLILIMVVGTQAKDAIVAAIDQHAVVEEPTESPLVGELATAEVAASAVERDFKQLEAKIAREKFEVDYRKLERDRLNAALIAAEQALANKASELSTTEREQYDLFAELNIARRELNDLKLARDAALNTPPTPGIIDHLPTPLAKTVFGKEVHLRLQNNKICYVPLNELVARLKEEAPRSAWKLKDANEITEVLGPLDGFRMKYTLRKVEKAVSVQGAVGRAQMIELDRFVLIPLTEDMGEPLAVALGKGSGLQALLAENPPERTTITVWVYPESFEAFRTLKAALFNMGYATAGRPLPEGHPIGGAPDGSHSAAQ
jgi:hypothetical protein